MEIYLSANDLPEEWDSLTGPNFYMRRKFLQFMESVDNCEQKYYVFHDKKGLINSIFMTYVRTHYNLFMFSPVTIYLKMTFIYVPISVTRPGIIYGQETIDEVGDTIKKIKGYKILLNLPQDLNLPGFVQGLTCPRCMLKIRWNSLDDYINDLRSNYRHRYKKAIKKGHDVKFYMLDDNKKFDDRLYSLYEQVYNNSHYKIEKLSKEFFQGEFFKIFVMHDSSGPVGFIQLIENGMELIFEFIGFNHDLNHKYDIYINLLLQIVRYGIENKFDVIDFGQTADEAKLKLGCEYEYLYALLNHSNPVINYSSRKIAPFIQYKPLDANIFHVFKEKK